MSNSFDDLARTLASPMPRRRALQSLGAALAVGAFPALRPTRASAADGCPGPTKRCFVKIKYGTHEGGCYYPDYAKCCVGPNASTGSEANLMSWTCPKDHDCGTAKGGFCPCPTKCKDGACCPKKKGRCVGGTCCPHIRTTAKPGSGGTVYCCPAGTIAVPDRVGLCCRKGEPNCCKAYDPNVVGTSYEEIRTELRDKRQVCVNGKLRKW